MELLVGLLGFFAFSYLLFQLQIRLHSWRASRPIAPGARVRVTYYVEAPEKTSAERIASELAELDLYGEIREPDPEEPDDTWECVASERALYELERLQERRRALDAVARRHGGKCETFEASRGAQSEWHGDIETAEEASRLVEPMDAASATTLAPFPIKRRIFGGHGTVRVTPTAIVVEWADGTGAVVRRREIRTVAMLLHPPFHERVVISHGPDASQERLLFLVRGRDRDVLAEALGF